MTAIANGLGDLTERAVFYVQILIHSLKAIPSSNIKILNTHRCSSRSSWYEVNHTSMGTFLIRCHVNFSFRFGYSL